MSHGNVRLYWRLVFGSGHGWMPLYRLCFALVFIVIVFGLYLAGFISFDPLSFSFWFVFAGSLTVGDSLLRLAGLIGRKKEEPTFVSERYAEEVMSKVTNAYGILLFCFCASLFMRQFIVAAIAASAFIVVALFGRLTTIRAERGWFGDNRYEALELLHFIISKSRSGGLPPGSRISRSPAEATQLRASPSEEAEALGSRA